MDSTAKTARIIRAWCNSAARNAATTVGSSTFRPLFIPGMAPVTSRGLRGRRAAPALRWPGDVNVRRGPANTAEHDENVIVRRVGGTREPVRPAYYYDLSHMVPRGRPANGTRPGPTAMSWSARAQSEPAAALTPADWQTLPGWP